MFELNIKHKGKGLTTFLLMEKNVWQYLRCLEGMDTNLLCFASPKGDGGGPIQFNEFSVFCNQT